MKKYKVFPNPPHPFNLGFEQGFSEAPEIGKVYEVDKQHQGHLSSGCKKMRITHIDELKVRADMLRE